MVDLGLWGSDAYRVPEKSGSDPDSSPSSNSP